MTIPFLISALIVAQADQINRYLYPSDATLLAVFDMEAVRGSGLFDSELRDGFERMLKRDGPIAELGRLLDFDPSRQIASVTVCGAGERGDRPSSLMIVNGALPYEKSRPILAQMVETGKLTGLEFQDLPIYFDHRARRAVFFALIDAQTMIASSSRKTLQDAIQGLTDLREPPEELALRITWDSDEETPAIRLAGRFPETARERLTRIPPIAPIAEDLVAYNVTVRFGKVVTTRARLTLRNDDASDRARGVFAGLIGLGKIALANSERRDLREMLDALDLRREGADLLFDLHVSRDQLTRILDDGRQRRERFRNRSDERKAEEKP